MRYFEESVTKFLKGFASNDIFNRAESTTRPSKDLFISQGKFHELSRMPSRVGQKQPIQAELKKM